VSSGWRDPLNLDGIEIADREAGHGDARWQLARRHPSGDGIGRIAVELDQVAVLGKTSGGDGQGCFRIDTLPG